MEQQDHIATLCAAGTVGIAVTGFALGVQEGSDSAYATTPGKRKWPGATSLKTNTTPQPPFPSRRVVSQPATGTLPTTQDNYEPPRPTSLFLRPSKRDVRPATANDSDATGSRGSSTNRSSMFRPRTADTRSTSERRDPSTSSSWLKRVSTISSPRASSPSANSSKLKLSSTPTSMITLESENKDQLLPNKLVKRSTSHRALSNDHARGIFLRRPATSHQRSATVHEYMPRETSYSTPATPYLSSDTGHIWRPFFERGYPRKRYVTANSRDGLGLRTISASNPRQPILMLGSHVEPSEIPDDQAEQLSEPQVEAGTMLTGRQKLKRSLSSVHRATRRRHVTDPTVKITAEAVNGTITSTTKQSPLSSSMQQSSYDMDLPHGTPTFSSSPSFVPIRHRFSFRKRQSMAPSDPTTVSSDNDTRVFTDDDSMDFQSDSAYDSLTTRATVSSHSAFRTPKLETVFNDPQAIHTDETDSALAGLVQKATLTGDVISHSPNQPGGHLYGIGISDIEEERDKMDYVNEPGATMTPIKSGSPAEDEYNMTPVPNRLQYFETPLKSSPPVIAPVAINTILGTPQFDVRSRHEELEDEDDIDWSPKSDRQEKTSIATLRQHATDSIQEESSSPAFSHKQYFHQLAAAADDDDDDDDNNNNYNNNNNADKRLSSIFDWSENQKVGNDGTPGALARPRTVHGKQAPDGSRSRSSGRKGAPQMHLRSQSVPNNRDPNAEPTPLSTSKFGTWGLGHKPVSEEWSDDFDFDDVEEGEPPQISSGAFKSNNRGTLRVVKVPQSIIDRQASVHIQFGQVQEFMLLVEELKSLRARGAALHLLETHSKQLWEDAESIIDLATINNEEDDQPVRPVSPTPFDVFGDETFVKSRMIPDKHFPEDSKRNSTTFRSVSSPGTPPQGRPRGESLAHAKNFLQSIHQNRGGFDSSPLEPDNQPQKKLPFDTQDLKDLVVRSGVITRALKEIVRKAEGLSVSPSKTPPRSRDPAFSQIFNAPDVSPCPPFRKPVLPKSQSANSYLVEKFGGNSDEIPTSPTSTALIL